MENEMRNKFEAIRPLDEGEAGELWDSLTEKQRLGFLKGKIRTTIDTDEGTLLPFATKTWDGICSGSEAFAPYVKEAIMKRGNAFKKTL